MEFKVDEIVYDLVRGRGKITRISMSDSTLAVKFDCGTSGCYNIDGTLFVNDPAPSLYKQPMKVVPADVRYKVVYEEEGEYHVSLGRYRDEPHFTSSNPTRRYITLIKESELVI